MRRRSSPAARARVPSPRAAAASAVALLVAMIVPVVARAQQPPPPAAKAIARPAQAKAGATIIRPLGSGPFGFPDADDPTRYVIVALDGVEVIQGGRTLKGDTLVAVLLPDAGKAGAPESGAPGTGTQAPDAAPSAPGETPGASGDDATARDLPPIADARLAELYLDGHVSMVEGGETISGASSFLLDNATGVATIVQGELRTVTHDGETLVARYDLLHRLQDGSSRMTGLRYTNCEHANPHWHIEAAEASLTPTPDGRILQTSGNTVRWGDVPVLWWPGLDLNVDRDRLLIHHVSLGHSTRFGTELETAWEGDATGLATGVAGLFGHEGKVHADWDLDLNLYSKRGLFTQPAVTYRTASSKGTLFASYINDSADTDHLDQPIDDNQRGRIDLEHRTEIDAHRTLDVELSRFSDDGYLREYYDNEFRDGKEQETYVSYRDVVDNHAWGVLARTRLNDFDTQVEYLPEVSHRIAGEQVGDAFLTMHDFISNARLLPSDDTDAPSAQTLRAGSDAEFTLPFDLSNGDRFSLKAGQGITGFSDTLEQGGELRYAADAGAEWSRTYVGTGEAHSKDWNIEGLRRIVELRAGYFNRFALTNDPDELITIDQVEQVDRMQLLTLGVRDRIQTHQDGKVATLLDSELTLPVYPAKDRDNDGDTLGPVQLDTRWTPHARITGLQDAALRWRASLDPETRHYVSTYTTFSTSIGEGRRLVVGNSSVAHQFDFLTVSVQWLLNPKWTVAVFLEQDTRNNDKVRNGILLRQRAHCWFIDVELSNRRAESFTGEDQDETRFSISLRPVGLDDEDLTNSIESRIF